MQTITFSLDIEEANYIINLIANLPIHSNAHPLFQKLMEQRTEQVKDIPIEENISGDW